MDLMVVLGGKLMGVLSMDRSGNPTFEYAEAWLADPSAVPLSLSLPLASTRHAAATVSAVLWGFLPDNERVLQRWSQQFHVSARSPVSLLSHVGEDCAGAVQFIRPDRIDQVLSGDDDSIQWLSDTELGERLRLLKTDAGASRRDSDRGQFSLPGAQPKIALLRDGERWGIPSGRVPTTHILKPPAGRFEGYAQNEHFCLRLAAALGFPTCASAVQQFDGEVAICVERYDRKRQQGQWLRIPQEDCCQALGVRPELKYQNDGGPSPRMIDALLRGYSSSPGVDRQTFFASLVFNWLIGGSDAHAKNYSLLLGERGGVRLAPLYDISSALPYPDIDKRKLKMAMKIGSNYRWHDIRLKDWMELSADMKLAEDVAMASLRILAEGLADVASHVASEVTQQDMGHPVVDRLVEEIAASARRCVAMLG